MIPKMILEPRLNLDTKLNFEPMIFRQYKACTPRASLRSLENEIKRIQRHVGQVEPGCVDFRPYQTCRPRDDLRSLENEIKRIQRHVGQVEPGCIDFRPYQTYRQRDSLQKLICESERVGTKKRWIKTQFGGRARNFRAARPARRDFKRLIFEPCDAYSQKSTLHSFPLAFEHVEHNKQWIQRHVGQVEPGCVDFRPCKTCTPRDDVHRLYLMKERLKPDKIESKPNLMAWRAARNFRARPFRPRLNLHTKLSFEPMIFRPYKTYRQRDSLQKLICESERVGSKKQRIQTFIFK